MVPISLAAYDYVVPKELIATRGAEPRESARMMAYERATGAITLSYFSELPRFLGPETVLVFNETKVIPARLRAQSGNHSVDITVTEIFDGKIQTLSSRRLEIGEEATCGGTVMRVTEREEQRTYYATQMSALETRQFLDRHGFAPLPPYIKDISYTPEESKTRYQTVFAKHEGSVAAPTAALHFSETLLDALRMRGVQIEFVTLHVGLGTFLPVTEENIEKKSLHTERYTIAPETAERLNEARRVGKRIIPVGTTSLRALESAADSSGNITHLSGETNLFIFGPYRFAFADGLITNFHVPQSSLLMLVDSFLGAEGKWRPLYQKAIEEKFRLFSFGDGMLIL